MSNASQTAVDRPVQLKSKQSFKRVGETDAATLAARLLMAANCLDIRIANLEAVFAAPAAFNGICLITTERDADTTIGTLLSRCGITVWSPYTDAVPLEGAKYESALCLILDMPDSHGLETLELFRRYGVWTPAILIMDNTDGMPAGRLLQAGPLAVLARPIDTRELLRWIECIYATQMSLHCRRALQAGMRPEKTSVEPHLKRAGSVPHAFA
jgi:DNA-binding NarL/FixJ family response regulator